MGAVSGVSGGRFASASRMMPAIGAPGPASMNSTSPKRRFRTSRNVRSSTTSSDAVRALSCGPIDTPFIQRCKDATTSREVIRLPSWNFSPDRSVKV